MIFTILDHRYTEEHLGLIPSFFSPHNPKPAADQLNKNYQHGGGWHPMPGFLLSRSGRLTYKGETIGKPIAMARLRNETIYIYPHAYVLIQQPDQTYEVARID